MDRTFLRLQDDLADGLLQTVGPQHQLLFALEEARSSSSSTSPSSDSPSALLRLLLFQLPLELRQALLAHLLLHSSSVVVVVIVVVVVLPLLLHDGRGGVGQGGQPGLALAVQGLEQGVQLLVQDGTLQGSGEVKGHSSDAGPGVFWTRPSSVVEFTAFGINEELK